MNVLTLESVGKSYGMDPLLEDVTFSLEDDEKIGIGPNGCVKTTPCASSRASSRPTAGAS